jgi:type II secretory pathway pseudopilin PulG
MRRSGFTLPEVLLATTLSLVVCAAAVSLLRSQVRAIAEHTERMEGRERVRAVVRTVERQLRRAGDGLPATEPALVQAAPFAVAFSVTRVVDPGAPARTDTISFWIARGASGALVLNRRVNARAADTLARELVLDSIAPFTYQRRDSIDGLVTVPASALPLVHAPEHGTPGDSGGSALLDEIRVVTLHLVMRVPGRDGASVRRAADATIRLPNAGIARH